MYLLQEIFFQKMSRDKEYQIKCGDYFYFTSIK